MRTNAKAKGHFCQVKKRDKVCKQNTGFLPKVAEALQSPLELRLHAVPLISSWAVELRSFQYLVFLVLQEAMTAYLGIWLSQIVLLFSYLLGSAVSLAILVTESRCLCLISLFYFFTFLLFFQLLYIYEILGLFHCMFVSTKYKRQKDYVRQQKDKNVNTCVVLFFHVPRAVLARGTTVTVPLLSTSCSS